MLQKYTLHFWWGKGRILQKENQGYKRCTPKIDSSWNVTCSSLPCKESWKNGYLILGTVKSEGSLEIFTIWGLLGNFSKIRRRNGSFSLVSAFASLCFNWKKETKMEITQVASVCFVPYCQKQRKQSIEETQDGSKELQKLLLFFTQWFQLF